MKPTLIHQPNHYNLQELLVNFAGGVPLSPDQLNFLANYEKTLSSQVMDPILKYYLGPFHKKSAQQSFLMHRENFDADAAKELKRRLELLVSKQGERVKLKFTPNQFQELKNSAAPSLIYFHGNQFLSGAPFYLGGISHVVFFQWGNLFGVAKYAVLAEERSLKSNVFIYFEDMHDRYLEQCVNDFMKDMRHELLAAPQPAHTNHLEKQAPHENYTHSPFQTPKLTLSLNTEKKEEK